MTDKLVHARRKRVSDDLDLIRGLAAFAVLVYHVRYRFFLDYRDVSSPDWFSSAFYALSSFGHDAVMIFFVLSGYFISVSVLRDETTGRWSWRRYAVNRCTRLYLVLLPGLLLTLLCDLLGLRLHPESPIYSGEKQVWHHDFFSVSERLNMGTFVANVLFLQTVWSPPFGSNEPLWSLSYEFWYYVLFPLGWFGLVHPTGRWKWVLSLVVIALLMCAVGKNIVSYFPIWLLGTAVCLLPQVPFLRRPHPAVAMPLALSLLCGVVGGTHSEWFKDLVSHSVVVTDYVTATAFALVLYLMLHNQSSAGCGAYANVAKLLAGCSYTLYVVHMPLLVFLRATLVVDAPWYPDPVHAVIAAVIAIGCLAFAHIVARLTEGRTDCVRKKVLTALALESSVTLRFASEEGK